MPSRLFLICLLGLLGIAALPAARAFQENPDPLRQLSLPPSIPAFVSVLPAFEENLKNFVASKQQLLETSSESAEPPWKKLSDHSASGLEILKLYQNELFPKTLFVLARQGLFSLHLKTRAWNLLYRTPFYLDRPQAFGIDPKTRHWILGTFHGLKVSKDHGKTWSPISASPQGPVSWIFFSKNSFFAVIGNALYRSTNLYSFENIFRLSSETRFGESEEDSFEENAQLLEDFSPLINSVFVRGKWLWLSSSKGLFRSFDEGKKWYPMPRAGIPYGKITHLVYALTPQRLFAASPMGVYEFNATQKTWKEIYHASGASEIRDLSISEKTQNLSILTSKQLFIYSLLPDQVQASITASIDYERSALFHQLIRLEPSALEVQRAVIAYANTKNSKINRWQKESRLKAILPNFSFGKDFSRDNNIDLDRGSTNEKDVFIEGPEDISRGWDMSVSWDLGDFIYSSDQTSIDSREKMMVELRHDLTAEATRLFYERRRLQMESILIPAENQTLHLQKLLQIEELSALLDSMTGGFMSGRLTRLYREYPEIERVWDWNKTHASRHNDTREKQ